MPYITHTNVTDYFELLAANHKSILHTVDSPRFFRSWDEVEEAKKGKIKFAADKAIMVIEEFSMRGAGNNQDTNHKERSIGIFILKVCAKKDFDFVETIVQECEQIQDDIMSRIKLDREDATNANIASYINANGWSADRIGPLLDNYYGYFYEHRLMSNVNLEYNPAKWL